MPPFQRWEDLTPDLLCRIGDSLDLNCYGSARGACTAWRRALAPLSPWSLIVPDDTKYCPSAASLATNRSIEFKPIPSRGRCVGSSNGWLALSVCNPVCLYAGQSTFSLFNPITATEIILPPLIYKSRWVSKTKLVFVPNPTSDDFAVAAIFHVDRVAYVTAGARRWAMLDPVHLALGDQLADVVYHEKGNGRVYCLTRCGDVHVLRLPARRRRKAIMIEDPSSVPAIQQHDMILSRSFGPDLNAQATVEPLLSLPFDPATSFAPPYNTISILTNAKNLVFVEDNLYQIWRNTSCTVFVQLPGRGRHRIAENEVLVLRYYPRRQPCWDAVIDFGGYSVFLGKNNAVSMNAQGGVPGIKGDCVYWIGGRDRDQGMVFDMSTGKSTACLLPAAAAGVARRGTVCWYFLSDKCNNNGGKIVYQTRARVWADREKQQDIGE